MISCPEAICVCCGRQYLRRWSPSPNLCQVCVSLDFPAEASHGRDALKQDVRPVGGSVKPVAECQSARLENGNIRVQVPTGGTDPSNFGEE